ncbi:MAG: protoporphyrinogen oxidase [Verrucomicrobia bacterium]|nr:protoporphyrinogen oxidase [Verrucomicrobiota bacterium]
MTKVCIIGAGISGLSTAWHLKKQGADCTVIETSKRVGGAIRTEQKESFLTEAGPNSIQLNSPEVAAFLESIPGLKDQCITAKAAAKKRFLVRNGKVHPVPMGPLQALRTPLWSLRAKLRVLKEPFISCYRKETDESVADFVTRRLGSELYRYAINPLVGGIYAGRPEALSLRYGFPKLYELEQTHGSLIRGALAKSFASRKGPNSKFKKSIISFKEGLETLPRCLAEALGSNIHTQAVLESIEKDASGWRVRWNGASHQYDRLILTVPAFALKQLPFAQNDLSDALEPLATIEYPPVSVLSLGFKKTAITHLLDGFGVLVPECEKRSILGVLFPSSFFEGRAPSDHALLTVFVGGDRQPHLSNDNAQILEDTVMPDLIDLLGISEKPVMRHIAHWSRAIPQYKIGYGEVLDTINKIESRYQGLQLSANYRHGISLTYCLEAALKTKI